MCPSCEDATCQGMCKSLDNFYNKYLKKDLEVLKVLANKVENLEEGQQQNMTKTEKKEQKY